MIIEAYSALGPIRLADNVKFFLMKSKFWHMLSQ